MSKKLRIVLVFVVIIEALLLAKFFVFNNTSIFSNEELIKNKVNFNYQSIKQTNKASALVNLDTNQVIYQNNMSQAQPVYSVSKTMLLATVAKEMEKNNISYDKPVIVTKLIDKVNTQANFSRANLKSNNSYTIKELFDATMISSGNDAAILLAYEIFGSHERAVIQMNNNAKEWGMKDSSFVSTSGLDGKYLKKIGIKAEEGKNMMSAKDAITLTKLVMKKYPEVVDSGSKVSETIGKPGQGAYLKLETVNDILEGADQGYKGIYGLKTGSNIEKYSDCIISLRKDKYNQHLAAVSFGSKSREDLYKDVLTLYKYTNQVEAVNLQDGTDLAVKVGLSSKPVQVASKKPFYLYVPKNQSFEYTLTPNDKYNKLLSGYFGVKKGDEVGTIKIENLEEFFGGTPDQEIKAVIK
ncbi:MAG: serine hydrolase [Erysipelotrichales bacterium]